MSKMIEFTGSPKPYFATKELFLNALSPYGYEHGKMTKRDNKCHVLCCDSPDSGTSKLKLASELGVEIVTYADLVELFDLEN